MAAIINQNFQKGEHYRSSVNNKLFEENRIIEKGEVSRSVYDGYWRYPSDMVEFKDMETGLLHKVPYRTAQYMLLKKED